MPEIRTDRLRLVPATEALLQAELRDPAEAARLLGATSPPDWPPPLNDRGTFAWMLSRLREHPQDAGWGTHYVVLGTTVVGTCGFKGAPAPPDDAVEIGYAVVPSAQRRGIATEAARGLVEAAFARGARTVRAHTLPPPEGDASIAVLRRLGFIPAPSTEEGAVGHALHAS